MAFQRCLLVLAACLLYTCGIQGSDPQATLDRAVAAHGSTALNAAVIEFDLEGAHYRLRHDQGRYRYERAYTTDAGYICEVMSNHGLRRDVDGYPVALTSAEHYTLEERVKTIAFLARLPSSLRDPGEARHLGDATLDGEPYYKIEVTFRGEGGGPRGSGRFVYWIHRVRHTVDYLAYGYGAGWGRARFLKAINPRSVAGVRFVDYLTYTAREDGTDLVDLDAAFVEDGLHLGDTLIFENVEVLVQGTKRAATLRDG